MIPDRIKTIIRDVAQEHGVEARDIIGASKRPALYEARHAAMRRVRASKPPAGVPPSTARIAQWFELSQSAVKRALRPSRIKAKADRVAKREAVRRASEMVVLRQRLTWLYGDADARIAANAPDLDAWNRLGESA